MYRASRQADSNRELERWVTDLRWRAAATENEIRRRFEPDCSAKINLLRTDETESAVLRNPETVLGLVVRYAPRPPIVEDDLIEADERAAPVRRKPPERKRGVTRSTR